MSDVTQILERVEKGDPTAAEELLPLVYEELRKLATHNMAHEAAGHTLQPTALVHEAWLRLVGAPHQDWNSRNHFFMAAAPGHATYPDRAGAAKIPAQTRRRP